MHSTVIVNSYCQTKKYLNSFINYERKAFFSYKKDLNLKRVYLLLEYLDVPYTRLKTIHIAGTKGKGSTASFCAFLLAASGYKVGIYTSPHLFDFRERIQLVQSSRPGQGFSGQAQSIVDSKLISKKDVTRIVKKFKRYLENSKRPKDLEDLSFFEVHTAIAFRYFLDKKVDFAVLETGLGGRLDATNVVNPLVSVLTHIGYDHTDKLGKSLRQITFEKAGIIKKGVPVICSAQNRVSLKEITFKCKLKKAPLFVYGRNFLAKDIRLGKEFTYFDFEFSNLKLRNLKIRLKGKYQVENSSLALAVCELLRSKGMVKNKIGFKKGLKSTNLEGRFEVLSRKPLIVVDIAHNVSSFAALSDNLRIYLPAKKVILIFACSKDKDAKNMLRKINYSYLILTRFNNPRSSNPREIKKTCNLRNTFITFNIKQALNKAISIYDKDSVIGISGSLFIVSEAKKELQKVPL